MNDMTLLYSSTSPFARKILMLIEEQGITSRVQLESAHPLKDSDRVQSINPLGKVPALMIQPDQTIINSPLICRYLNQYALKCKASQLNLIHPHQMNIIRIEQLEALADGIMDASYLHTMETLRPHHQQSDMWKSRWLKAIQNSLLAIQSDFQSILNCNENHIGKIALAAALGYLNFRLTFLDWRRDSPFLSDWFNEYQQRYSFQNTQPIES